MHSPLPFALPDITEEEISAVLSVLKSGWITTGPQCAAFEKAFAEAVQAPHAIAVHSATAGLHLCVAAAGITQNDIVIVPTNTFTATAEAVLYTGAQVLFADSHPVTMNLDPESLQRQIELLWRNAPEQAKRIKAIIPVHMAGLCCDMAPLQALAKQYGWTIIEDAAHAFPCVHNNHHAGTFGQTGVFSFYATKPITTAEGGMIVTHDEKLATRIRTLRLHGIDREVWDRYTSPQKWYYEVVETGFKYNLTDIAAAMGLVQLRRSPLMHGRRQAIARAYRRALAKEERIILPPEAPPGDIHAWHLFILRLKGVDRNNFIHRMAQQKIGCSVHFIPLHLHPLYQRLYNHQPDDFPVAFSHYQQCLSLPIYSSMSDHDIDRIIDAVQVSLQSGDRL